MTLKKTVLLAAAIFIAFSTSMTFAGRIIYVDTDATGANDGTSWSNAYIYLQDALSATHYRGDEIWVAKGTYKPDEDSSNPNGTGNRETSFILENSIILTGGYAGFGELDPNRRDFEVYETILNGDLNGDDGVDFANYSDNSYHVVRVIGSWDNDKPVIVLQGFSIIGGNADRAYDEEWCSGGGLYNNVAMSGTNNPTIIKCTFRDNIARWGGGGLYSGNNYDKSSIKLVNCTFINNRATFFTSNLGWYGSGGGIYTKDNATLINCVFSQNSAFRGGGMYNLFGDSTLINCTFSKNSALNSTGGIKFYGDTVQLTNCILWGNTTGINGVSEQSQISGSYQPIINYCCIQNWSGAYGGIDNFGGDPLFVDEDYSDYHLLPSSPCIDAGDPNVDYTGQTDIDGEPRVLGGRVDIGADEYSGSAETSLWSFVQITDLHIGGGAGSNYDYDGTGWDDDGTGAQEHLRAKLLQSLVEEINAKKDAYNIKFVVCTGDLTDTAESSEFIKVKDILNNLTVPWIPLLGNHDAWPAATKTNKAPEVDADNYGADQYFYDAFEEAYTNFESELNPAPGWNWWKNDTAIWDPCTSPEHYCYLQNFWFDYAGYHFIGLDLNYRDNDYPSFLNDWYPFGSNPEGCLHDFEGGTWRWFKDHLTSYIGSYPEGKKNVILLSHHPFRQVWQLGNIIGPLSEKIYQEMSSLNIGFYQDDLAKVKTFLDEHNDRIWCQIAGHSHENKETKIGTIPIVETGTYKVVRRAPGPMGTIIDILSPVARVVQMCSNSAMNNYNEILLGKSMSIFGFSPIDLEVTDPNGQIINKNISEIPGAWYIEEDIDHDGNLDRIVFIPERISGDYQIRVIPQPDANSTDTYTLVINTAEGSSGQVSTVLAQDVPISEIPTEPYILGAGELIDTQFTYTGALQGNDGEVVILEATLTDSTAAPISNQTITFNIGTQTTLATTDVNGIAACTLQLQQVPSEFYVVDVSFAGTENYKPATVSVPFAILSLAPVVSIASPKANGVVQDSVTLTAEANDASGVASVYFYIREPNDGNGVPIGQENLAATFNTTTGKWQYNFDTAQLQDDSYIVLAKAVDIYSNETWSVVVPFSSRNLATLKVLPSAARSKPGSVIPVKFSLSIPANKKTKQPAIPFVYNEDLEIRIYKKARPTNILLQTSLFGTGVTDYHIDLVGKLYITNFQTESTPVTYIVDVWRPAKNFKVGSFTFATTK